MAKKTRTASPTSRAKVEFKGYVNYPVNKQVAEDFRMWFDQQSHILEMVMEFALKDQLKFSVGEDTYHEAYTASYMCQDRSNPACGCVLTAWSKDMYEAVALLVYKHYVLAGRQWHFEAQGRSTDFEMG